MYEQRRYVGFKESMAYVLYDSSKTFNIDEFKNRFILDVLKIDLGWNSLIDGINGVWDVVNDSFLGALVDRTSTRWGKFRPYLFLYATLGTLTTCLFWLTPIFFDKNQHNVGKMVFWLILAMVREMFSTVRSVSETGMLGSISPNPDDRVRLYTRAELISSIWENIPQFLMGALMDLVNHGKVSFSLDNTYFVMGTVCAVIGGVLAIFFAVYSKERIAQAAKRPSYREGLMTIVRNRPLLMIMLANFLDSFSVVTWEHNYFIDVLGSESLRNIVNLPGAPLSFVSYAWLNKARARFNIKPLWIIGKHTRDFLSVGIFIIGSLRGMGSNGIYQQVLPMSILMMIRSIGYNGTMSLNKVIPREILLDALDYAEWKNGYRTEGVTLATKSMLEKIVKNAINALTSLILKVTGYDLHAGFGGQSDRVKYSLFFMALFFPAAAGLLGSIPKFFYDLTGSKRQQMHEELAVMRHIRQKEYDADAQTGNDRQALDF